ncbi:MAG: hypothetical protein HZB46_17780 [Solirubrobacterales bacterium]|nr:hypothetical protein [Solirubrobacterales bacterium]
MTLRRLRSDEGGWVLATAIGLMAIMLGVVLATMGYVDTQQKESGTARTREAAFNLAEAAMTAQIFALTQEWPGKGRSSDPYAPCTQASVTARCPNSASLTNLLSSPDATQVTWRTEVRDNNTAPSQTFYSDEQTASSPGYDSNGDGKVWVRAKATALGRTRTMVALVRVEDFFENMPHGAVIAGRLDLSNMGNKIIIDGTGAASGSKVVAVRCTPQSGESAPCLGHAIGQGGIKDMTDLQKKLNQQIAPNVTTTNFNSAPALDASARDRLRKTAIADGTYYASCPASLPSGKVVWIESGACSWTSNAQGNSSADPGMLIINNGSVYLGGTTNFYGVLYAVNAQATTGPVVQVQGNATVTGGVIIDGQGTLIGGSSKLNVKLDDNAFNKARSYVSAGMIQNTWREIDGS